ncbi:MAG: plasmid mobilization protein [Mycobacterium sp.]
MADPTQWADEPLPTPARRSAKRQRAAMISIRLSEEELETVQAEAAARGLTISRYVRDRALEPATSRPTRSGSHFLVVTNTTSKAMGDLHVQVVEESEKPLVPYLFAPGLAKAGASS